MNGLVSAAACSVQDKYILLKQVIILAGIVSFGVGCAAKDYPGAYTRTSCYLKWIANNVGLEGSATTSSQSSGWNTKCPFDVTNDPDDSIIISAGKTRPGNFYQLLHQSPMVHRPAPFPVRPEMAQFYHPHPHFVPYVPLYRIWTAMK